MPPSPGGRDSPGGGDLVAGRDLVGRDLAGRHGSPADRYGQDVLAGGHGSPGGRDSPGGGDLPGRDLAGRHGSPADRYGRDVLAGGHGSPGGRDSPGGGDLPGRHGSPADRYGQDVLAGGRSRPAPDTVVAEPDVVAEDPLSGFCGAVVACTTTAVTLEDRFGARRMFPLAPGAFLVDGRPATLVRPSALPARGPARSASGSIAVPDVRARTARAARIWVEGIHDAALVERVWGHDLRVEGVVVEPLDGLDNLPAAVTAFRPGPARRLGVLADHLVPGTKESRIVSEVSSPHVLVAGHPYVDIWQAVRPSTVGIAAWPEVPRGTDWKRGVCAALGIADPATMWGRINGAVRSFRDLDTPLITAVESLIDFVTAQP